MVRIWAKVYRSEHIEKQFTFSKDAAFSYADFFGYLAEICDTLDIPTPVLLKAHILNYAKFHHAVFRPRDFVESVSFDKLVLESI